MMGHWCSYCSVICLLASALAAPACAQVSVTTESYDSSRTSSNLNETILNQSNVNVGQFGKLFSYTVDGSIYAQPLYVQNVKINGAAHNVVYVVTMNDVAYAFDADTPQPALWTHDFRSTTASPVVSWTTNIEGHVGIEGTPVIDTTNGTNGTIFFVTYTSENGSPVFRLHGLDIASGAEQSNGGVVIAATVSGVVFIPSLQQQRPGLAIVNGNVFIAFGSFDDSGLYQGWVFAYNESTFQRTFAWPDINSSGTQAGIWMSGRAPVVDSNGNVYYSTGNGTYDGTANFGDSLLKFSTSPGIALADWFTPSEFAFLDVNDEDLGSAGFLLVPGTSTALIGAGKEGNLYVTNAADLGHEWPGNSQITQQFYTGGAVYTSPAYWNNTLYLWPIGAPLSAYSFNGSTLNTTPVSQGPTSFGGSYSGALAVSANGTTAGTGIVWVTEPAGAGGIDGPTPGILRAFQANDLTIELWNSGINPTDALGNWSTFRPPTVANGKVYVGTLGVCVYAGVDCVSEDGTLQVYGELTAAPPPSCPCTIWSSSTTPTVVDGGPGGAVELGVRFAASMNGTITRIRFYKSANNTGTHIGNLWDSSGNNLATATFTNEGTSGWQQVDFSSPVAITANTVYVASYHTNVSHFSVDLNYFATAGVNNPPLQALANGVSGANGVYTYATTSTFPSSTYQSANYWVDVVFAPTTTASLVSIAVTPNDSLTVNVGGTEQFTATGWYSDSSTQNISTQVTWSSTNQSAATINSTGLATGVGVASSAISAALSGINSNNVTLTVQPSVCPCTVWTNNTVPASADNGPDSPVELGVRFTSSVAGTITGIRFYKSANNTGTHIGNLWDSSGNNLASATFTSETASGWQQVIFTTPVSINANTIYVASYHTTVGHYSADQNFFTAAVNNPPVQFPAGPGNGVYRYGASAFPNNSYNSTNYWVDVMFEAGATVTPPSCTTATPCMIWNNTTTPTVADAGQGLPVELGVRFTSSEAGWITGIRFYKGVNNTGLHTGTLWSSAGAQLATGTFIGETASGWQQVTFATPVAITANTTYVASYHTTVGHYSADQNFFTTTGVNNAPLEALPGNNGVYVYGPGGVFPSNSYNSTNYWVDVVLQLP